jgi:hypothetical protein
LKQIKYTKEFQQAVHFAHDNGIYVGTGNPNGDLLIIGKEAAICMGNNEDQYNIEIKSNSGDWLLNIKNNTQFSDVADWVKTINPKFNPIYPYKGQMNLVESRNEHGEIVRGKGGTSRTWFNYQKIIDQVYYGGQKNSSINFHEYAFCTELNQLTGKYSKDIPMKDRHESIEKRKPLFELEFFRQFPITIVAVGHYVRDFNIDLEKLFDVSFHPKESKKYSAGLGRDFINIHYGTQGGFKKLLIHTNQLSMVGIDLLNRLSRVCASFSIDNEGRTY